MELLGYELIKINKDSYDASVVARHESLVDILAACEEKNLDIVAFGNGQLILKEL